MRYPSRPAAPSHNRVANARTHGSKRCFHLPPEAAVEQQVLRRIAGERELGEDHKIGPEIRLRATRRGDYALRVALDVSDQKIELGKREPE